MGVSGSSGVTQVTGNVNVDSATALLSATQTPIVIYTTCNGSMKTEYTVPAGYKFRLMGFSLAHAATSACTLAKTDGTTYIINGQTPANGSFIFFPGYDIHTYASGEFVKLIGTSGSHPIIYGILEAN